MQILNLSLWSRPPSIPSEHQIRISRICYHDRKEQESNDLLDECVLDTSKYRNGQTRHIVLTAKKVELRFVCCSRFAERRLSRHLAASIVAPCLASTPISVKHGLTKRRVVLSGMITRRISALLLF
jgi:hypothetical protein